MGAAMALASVRSRASAESLVSPSLPLSRHAAIATHDAAATAAIL
jgi:hypothetical protein